MIPKTALTVLTVTIVKIALMVPPSMIQKTFTRATAQAGHDVRSYITVPFLVAAQIWPSADTCGSAVACAIAIAANPARIVLDASAYATRSTAS